MNSKILFMIVDNQVLYLSNSNMDHKEWYVSLGFDASNFDNVIRGFVIDNKIIFYKGFFEYDDTVIKYAETFSPSMKEKLNNPSLEVYCGILPGKPGEKWEPILKIGENVDNSKFSNVTKIERKVVTNDNPKEVESLIDIKNDYSDELFLNRAKVVTIVLLVINFILKIILYSTGVIQFSNTFNNLIVFIEFMFLGISVYLYIIKNGIAKYFSFVSGLLIIFSLDIYDIILGLLYLIYVIDESIFTKLISKIKK